MEKRKLVKTAKEVDARRGIALYHVTMLSSFSAFSSGCMLAILVGFQVSSFDSWGPLAKTTVVYEEGFKLEVFSCANRELDEDVRTLPAAPWDKREINTAGVGEDSAEFEDRPRMIARQASGISLLKKMTTKVTENGYTLEIFSRSSTN